MKISDFAIPYPILGIEGAFSNEINIAYDVEFESYPDKYNFNISFTLNEPNILELIQEGKASYACEMDCAKTFFRETYKSQEANFTVSIPKTAVVGDVLLFLSVVVESDIKDYCSENFNQKFYAGYKFNLSKGHMLAYFGQEKFNANIKYDELKAIGSIMEVKVDAKSKFTYYDFGGDMITIFLPQTEYNNFRRTNNHTLSNITHASIVQCALISALSSYKENSNTLWAQTLKIRVQNESKLEKFVSLEDLNHKEIMEMVSIILDNPNYRMFNTLNAQINE